MRARIMRARLGTPRAQAGALGHADVTGAGGHALGAGAFGPRPTSKSYSPSKSTTVKSAFALSMISRLPNTQAMFLLAA